MEGPSSLSSWPPRHGTTAPRLPPPDRAARGARSPRTCQCRRTRPLPLLSHDAATAPPSRNERGPPVGLLLMVPPSAHVQAAPAEHRPALPRLCHRHCALALVSVRYFRSHHPTPRLLIHTYMYTAVLDLSRSVSLSASDLSLVPSALSKRGPVPPVSLFFSLLLRCYPFTPFCDVDVTFLLCGLTLRLCQSNRALHPPRAT